MLDGFWAVAFADQLLMHLATPNTLQEHLNAVLQQQRQQQAGPAPRKKPAASNGNTFLSIMDGLGAPAAGSTGQKHPGANSNSGGSGSLRAKALASHAQPLQKPFALPPAPAAPQPSATAAAAGGGSLAAYRGLGPQKKQQQQGTAVAAMLPAGKPGQTTGQGGVKRAAALLESPREAAAAVGSIAPAAVAGQPTVQQQLARAGAACPGAAAAHSFSQPNALGSTAAAQEAPPQLISLDDLRQLVIQRLKQGTLSLKPGAFEMLLRELGISIAPAAMQKLRQLFMGPPSPWVAEALQLAEQQGVKWQAAVEWLLEQLSRIEGCAVSHKFRPIRGPSEKEQGVSRDKAKRQKQKAQQSQPDNSVMDVDVRLPAAAQWLGNRTLEAGGKQFDEEHGAASRFRVGDEGAINAFCAMQTAFAPFMFFSVQTAAPKACKPGLPAAARKTFFTKQQQQLGAKLEREGYAMLAGMLKWQLPGEHAQLLEEGEFARLQVPLSDGEYTVAAKPSVGSRRVNDMTI